MLTKKIVVFIRQRAYFLSAFIGFWLLLPLSVLVISQYFENQQAQVYLSKRQQFMANEFHEMRSRIEFLFERIHQNNQAVAHIPDVRILEGLNPQGFEQDKFAPERLHLSDLLTMVQIYSNLSALYEISEMYIVLDDFEPDKGERPLLKVSDLVNPSVPLEDRVRMPRGGIKRGRRNVPGPVVEWELGAYRELARSMEYYRERMSSYNNGKYSNFPDFVSKEVQVRPSPTNLGDRTDLKYDSFGFLISTPVTNFDGELVGVVATAIPNSLLEGLLLQYNKPLDLEGSKGVKTTNLANESLLPFSQFAIINRQHHLAIYDRRHPDIGDKIQGFIKRESDRQLSDRILVTSDESVWHLLYYFDQGFEDQAAGRLKALAPMAIASAITGIFLLALLLSWAMDRFHFVRRTLGQIDEQRRKNETLLRVVAHDINNPLSIILGTLQLVFDEKKRDDLTLEQVKSWQRIQRAADMIDRTLNNVRNLQAIRSGKMNVILQDVSVESLIDEVRFIFAERFAEKQIQFIVENSMPVGTTLQVDPSIFSGQVMQNLVSNAIKFSRNGDTVTLRFAKNKEWIHIAIIDSGIGIPEEILANIFDPSTQTNRRGTNGEIGTGFGMPLAKVYMDALGGRIFVESLSVHTNPNNHGTTVHIHVKEGLTVSKPINQRQAK